MKTFDEAFYCASVPVYSKSPLQQDLQSMMQACIDNKAFPVIMGNCSRILFEELATRDIDPIVKISSALSSMFVIGLRVGIEMEKPE